MTVTPDEPRALAAIRRGRVLPVLRLREHGRAVEIAETLVAAGVQALEITLGDPVAHQAIASVIKAVGNRVPVGAGTVLDREEPRRLADLGVAFCVSPHVDPVLVEAALAAGLVPLPGTFTPTEVMIARAAGAPAVKLFPAGPAGTGHLKALLGPFPDLAVVPTAGITIDEVPVWLAAGAIAVGLGSDLVTSSGSLDGLQERAARAVRIAGKP